MLGNVRVGVVQVSVIIFFNYICIAVILKKQIFVHNILTFPHDYLQKSYLLYSSHVSSVAIKSMTS